MKSKTNTIGGRVRVVMPVDPDGKNFDKSEKLHKEIVDSLQSFVFRLEELTGRVYSHTDISFDFDWDKPHERKDDVGSEGQAVRSEGRTDIHGGTVG